MITFEDVFSCFFFIIIHARNVNSWYSLPHWGGKGRGFFCKNLPKSLSFLFLYYYSFSIFLILLFIIVFDYIYFFIFVNLIIFLGNAIKIREYIIMLKNQFVFTFASEILRKTYLLPSIKQLSHHELHIYK